MADYDFPDMVFNIETILVIDGRYFAIGGAYDSNNTVMHEIIMDYDDSTRPSNRAAFLVALASMVDSTSCLNEECIICSDLFDNDNHYAVRTACGHVFGFSCIETWLKTPCKSTCPTCRRQFFVPNDAIDQEINITWVDIHLHENPHIGAEALEYNDDYGDYGSALSDIEVEDLDDSVLEDFEESDDNSSGNYTEHEGDDGGVSAATFRMEIECYTDVRDLIEDDDEYVSVGDPPESDDEHGSTIYVCRTN